MRKLILKMHTSLDGYVEGKKGDMGWMQTDDDQQWDDLFEVIDNVDLFLLGRGMWADYREHWKNALVEPGKFSANEVKYARLAEKTKHIVFSKTLKKPGWKNTIVNSGDLETEIKKIKEAEGGDIQIVGGAEFVAALLDTGLVDEYHIMVNPAIVAGGKSFFHQIKNRHSLELVKVKQLSNQVVVLTYKQMDTNSKENQNPVKRRAENNS